MPYPRYVAIPTQSLPTLTTESDPASLTILRISAPATGLQYTFSAASSSTQQLRGLRFGLGKVFANIRNLFHPSSASKRNSVRISKPQPLRRSGGVGYVMPHERKGLNAHASGRGRGSPQYRVHSGARPTSKAGLCSAGRVAKSSMRSRRSRSDLSALAKMAGHNLSSGSMLPDVIASDSNEDGRPYTPVVAWTAHARLFVTNPDDGASILSATTIASSSHTTEQPESYEEFEARLAEHARPMGALPPHLQSIPYLAPIDLDAAPVSSHIQHHRDDALRRLEGGAPTAVRPQAASLSSTIPVPVHNIPATLKPQMHPQSLLPGPRYHDHEGVERVRPMTYQAPPPPAWKFEDPLAFEGKDYNSTMKYHKAKPSNGPSLGRPRVKTPESFASAAQHKSFYDRVESGVFDDVVVPVLPPADLMPPPLFSSAKVEDKRSVNNIDRTFLDSPTPTSSRVPSTEVASGVRGAKVTKKPLPKPSSTANTLRKPLPPPKDSVQKPLPSLPAPRPTNTTVPARHKINDNGYPLADLQGAGARYSATPVYQPRTVDYVEAKLQQDLAETKVAKKEAKAAAKAAAKVAAQAAKKELKAQQKAARQMQREKFDELVRKQREVEAGVRRIIYA